MFSKTKCIVKYNIGDLLMSHGFKDKFVIGWIIGIDSRDYYLVQWSDRHAIDTHSFVDIKHFRNMYLKIREDLNI